MLDHRPLREGGFSVYFVTINAENIEYRILNKVLKKKEKNNQNYLRGSMIYPGGGKHQLHFSPREL